jgi:hypothetical protein
VFLKLGKCIQRKIWYGSLESISNDFELEKRMNFLGKKFIRHFSMEEKQER